MKRLHLTVEGQTEQAFVVDVLAPHLGQFNVFAARPRLSGPYRRRGARVPRGGMFNRFMHALEDMRRWMREDRSPDARFSMMVDLYSLPSDFPGYDQAMNLSDPHARADSLARSLADELAEARFIPYLQVHEFEALVLSCPDRFVAWFDGVGRQVERLKRECDAFESPELIDDGQHTHPKARIKRHIPDYDENVDGPALAADIGLARIRNMCPHFDRWVTTLERLDAGSDG